MTSSIETKASRCIATSQGYVAGLVIKYDIPTQLCWRYYSLPLSQLCHVDVTRNFHDLYHYFSWWPFFAYSCTSDDIDILYLYFLFYFYLFYFILFLFFWGGAVSFEGFNVIYMIDDRHKIYKELDVYFLQAYFRGLHRNRHFVMEPMMATLFV